MTPPADDSSTLPARRPAEPPAYARGMTLLRMDNILIVVDDLDGAIEFFGALGLALEGRTIVEGDSVDRIVGIDGVRSEIATMRTPEGQGVELDKFHAPPAIRPEPQVVPVNTLGIRRIMFAVDDIEEVVVRVKATGAELMGEVIHLEDAGYLMCYVRGPEGIMVGLAQQLS
jgi:catechol 2,3-dioxygenase-like lactoylglutathione lyase family enzyme